MSSERVFAKVRARVVLEVVPAISWDPACSVAQLREQGTRHARSTLKQALARARVSGVRLVDVHGLEVVTFVGEEPRELEPPTAQLGRSPALADFNVLQALTDAAAAGVPRGGLRAALYDVVRERARQAADFDAKHDDAHQLGELIEHVREKLELADGALAPLSDVRKRMVQAAAIALATVESIDRRAALAATPESVRVLR